MAATAHGMAASLGSHDVVELESTSASLQHAAAGRQFSGPVYVATPQLLQAFGIKASQVDSSADILTMRPGLSGLSKMQLTYGNYGNGKGGHAPRTLATRPPTPARRAVASPTQRSRRSAPFRPVRRRPTR